MKRKLFNFGLYLDSLRRTSLLGVLFTALLCIQSAIVFFGFTIGCSNYDLENIKVTVETVTLLEINPCILLIPAVFVPLLMLTLFGFLNNRSTSDFWHSTPFSRECIYITFVLTALTWAVVAAVLSTALSAICFSLMPKFFAINYASVLGLFLSSLAMAVLVAGAFAIASSLTGTLLNTLVVATIILILPRVIMIYFSALISNGMLFYGIPYEGFNSISLNQIFGLVFGIFFGGISVSELLSNYSSICYTVSLGVVYLIIGLIFFKHRKSEAASYSSVNKYLQTALRIIVAFVVCLIPIYIITSSQKERDALYTDQIFTCFVLYVVAIVVYFLYELITTKKAKNMLKAIPALAILAVVNIAMIIAVNKTYKAEYNYTPTPQTVSAIRISESIDNNIDNYFKKIMSITDINDHQLETLLCDLYVKTREAYENESIYSKYSNTATVGFKSGNTYKYRKVYMTDEDYEKYGELLAKNREINSIYNIENILKDAVHNDVSLYIGEDFYITDEERQNIMDAYFEDVNSLPFNEWYYIACNPYTNYITTTDGQVKHYKSIGKIYTSVNVNGATYYVNLPIDNRMTKTFNLIMSMVFEHQKDNNTQQIIFDVIKNDTNISKDIYVELYNGTARSSPEGYSLNNKEIAQKFIETIAPSLDQLPSASSRIATVHYDAEEKNSYKSITGVFKVPDDADLTFFIDNLID